MEKSTAPQDSQYHELHSALKSCEEIHNAKSLLQWIKDLERDTEFKLTDAKHSILDSDKKFRKFAMCIIVAHDAEYDVEVLHKIACLEHKKNIDITELINQCLIELFESRDSVDREKLQCIGFQ